ncbi:MAG: ABC transporter permease [Phyllobacterium sp.]
MLDFILRRLFQGLLVVFGVTLAVFLATRVFGDPVALMLPITASAEQRAAFSAQIGLDQPLPVQFLGFIQDMLTLNFGDSIWQRRPAIEVVFERLPNSLLLIACGLGLAVALAVPLGALSALKPGSIFDRITMSLGLIGLATPQFFFSLLLILVFAVNLRWLPTSGMGSPAHLVLPVLALAMTPFARFALMVRSTMIEELNQQYVRTARARGIPPARILRRHALRNILVPFVTLSGWELIVALSGYTVVVETVFSWPGLGMTAVQAIQRGDLFLMQAIVFTIAFAIVCINLAIDIIAKCIDPRIELN